MILSVFFILLFGAIIQYIFSYVKFPALIGLFFLGVLLGPQTFNFIDPTLLQYASEIRQVTFAILLLRVGMSVNLGHFKQSFHKILCFGFLPATFEIVAVALFSFYALHFPLEEALLFGVVLGSLSPAVVMPLILDFMKDQSHDKQKPFAEVLSFASIDNIFILMLFPILVTGLISQEPTFSMGLLLLRPIIMIVCSVLIGGMMAYFFWHILKCVQPSFVKGLLVFILGVALYKLPSLFSGDGFFQLSSIILVLSFAFCLARQAHEVASEVSIALRKLWFFGEILFFVFFGSYVSWDAILQPSGEIFLVIGIGLLARALVIGLVFLRYQTSKAERWMVFASHLPKATIQVMLAPLFVGFALPSGPFVLSVSIWAILITAPLGAILIQISGRHLVRGGVC